MVRFLYKAVTEFNPWERSPPPSPPSSSSSSDDEDHQYCSPDITYYYENLVAKRPRFSQRDENIHLDINTKRAAFSASPFVVSIVTYSGDVELNQGSGTIVESNEDGINIVFTSARLFMCIPEPGKDKRKTVSDDKLADNLKVVVRLFDDRTFEGNVCGHDFYYNIAAITFKSNSLLQTATLTHVDESFDLNPRQSISLQETSSFQLRRHSSSIKLIPGDLVVATGRYFAAPYEIMAAPGEFSVNRYGKYNCEELLNSTAKMTQCGDGGPLVNLSGEVLGIGFYDYNFTPFLPIQMAYKWWEICKRDSEQVHRPSLGLEVTNFYNIDLNIAEKIIVRFPSVSKGVVVRKVLPGSFAESAGLSLNDVIIECAGKVVQSFLEFMEILWDHVGQPVDLVVVRADLMNLLCLKMMVAESASHKLKCWPSLER